MKNKLTRKAHKKSLSDFFVENCGNILGENIDFFVHVQK
jgi:hypothetical protein